MSKYHELSKKVLKLLAEEQATEFGTFPRSEEYKGWWLNDDECTLLLYRYIERVAGIPKAELKPLMIELRNNGLVELIPAVNADGAPNGSGWSITYKGLQFAVDNGLLTH